MGKRKIIKYLLYLIIISMIAVAYGCSEPSEIEHIHQYDSRYEYDENFHWHNTICSEHEAMYSEKEKHTFGEWNIIKEADEYNDGLKERKCLKCDYVENKSIPMLEHTHTYDYSHWDYDENYHYHKSTCSHDLKIDNEIHAYGEWNVITMPTEDSSGYKTRICNICGYVQGEEIKKLEHTHKYDTSYEMSKDGHYTIYYCKGCDYSYKSELEAHVFSDKGGHMDPTCEMEGYDEQICDLCYYSKMTKLNKLPHNLEYTEETESTCTKQGNKGYYTCLNCHKFFWDENGTNEILNFDETIKNVLDHDFSDWTITIKPTINSTGERIRTCSVCSLVERDVIAQLDHICDYSDKYTITEEGHVYEPSCYICGNELETKTTTHIYEYGKCTECGFDVTEHTSITLPIHTKIGKNAFKNCTKLQSITLPKDVISIGESAFEGCENLTNVILPIDYDSKLNEEQLVESYIATFYGNYAFKNCSSLLSVPFIDGIERIGAYTFYGCTSLKEISMPETLTYVWEYAFYGCTSLLSEDRANNNIFKNLNLVYNYAFYGCTSLTNVNLNNIDYLYDYAFENCTSVTNVHLADDIYTCGDYVFKNCTSLKYFNLPKGGVRDTIIDGCTNLELIEIGLENYNLDMLKKANVKKIVLKDNVSKTDFMNMTSLVEITLGTGVTEISNNAFYGCNNLTKVNWHNNITKIGKEAFSLCESLNDLTFPTSLVEIGESAFYQCLSLTSITIPDSVTIVDLFAFAYCRNVKTIKLSNNLETISSNCFSECNNIESIIIPDSVKTIKSKAFLNCYKLSEIYFSKNITSFSTRAFDYYDDNATGSRLKNIYFNGDLKDWINFVNNNTSNLQTSFITKTIAKTLENIYFLKGNEYELVSMISITKDACLAIPEECFARFPNLKTVIISDGISEIGMNAFSECKNLVSVEVHRYDTVSGSGLKIIGDGAFYKCDLLETFKITSLVDDLETIGYSAFSDCSALTTVSLPNSITTINGYAFNNCPNLKINKLPNGLKIIDEYTFQNCTSLYLSSLPNSLEEVRGYAFYKARLTNGIRIPASVQKIGEMAFAETGYTPTIGSYALCSIILNTNVLTIASNAFDKTNVLYEGSYDEYKNDFSDLTLPYIYYYSDSKPDNFNRNYWYYNNSNEPIDWNTSKSLKEYIIIKIS